jgi:hypothetical protein
MALTSAGAITAVIANVFGNVGVQLLAALSAALSGTISLVVNAYFTDDEIVAMLTGSSKYLALRENIRRTLVHRNLSDDECLDSLKRFQHDYFELDTIFSRFFPSSDKDEGPVSSWRGVG